MVSPTDRTTVLHLHSGNLFGGVETTLVTLCRVGDVVPLRHDFLLAFDGRLREELTLQDARIHLVGPVRLRRPWSVARARRLLARRLARKAPAACICHSAWGTVLYGPVVRRSGTPLVSWVHGPVDAGHWLERWAARTPPDLTICNSAFTLASVRAAYPERHTETIHEVVSPPEPDPTARGDLREAHGAGPDSVVILHVARMEAWKGHAVLLDAAARLDPHDQWVLWYVGGAQRTSELRYEASLRQKSIALGLEDRVRFVGDRRDAVRFYAAADIYCQPNAAPEPFGITFIEALYAGLPVIATGVGGPAEIVDASCGFTVALGDVDGVADILQRLVRDPTLRLRLARAGPARARALSDPESQATKLHKVITELVSDR